MKFVCSQGECFDSIAYNTFKDEMLYPQIMEANRKYSDVVMFDGGEEIEIPDELIIDNLFVTRPYQKGAELSIISAPWTE